MMLELCLEIGFLQKYTIWSLNTICILLKMSLHFISFLPFAFFFIIWQKVVFIFKDIWNIFIFVKYKSEYCFELIIMIQKSFLCHKYPIVVIIKQAIMSFVDYIAHYFSTFSSISCLIPRIFYSETKTLSLSLAYVQTDI